MTQSPPATLRPKRVAGPPLALRPDMRAVPPDAALTARIPRISAGVFYDTPAAAKTLSDAMLDRRLSRVTAHLAAGGIAAAIAYCSTTPTPDLLVIETSSDGADILAGLEALAPVCNTNTKVIVIGRPNDIGLYREMIARGVSDYIVAPMNRLFAIVAILTLYQAGGAVRNGRICAFLGAKGGVGASTLAHNVAWSIGESRSAPVMLADLDLQFGTAALNLDLNPAVGTSEQVMDPERLDEALLERTLIPCGKHLHVLAASGRMQEIDPPDLAAVEKILGLSRKMFPVVVLDLPHLQSPWIKAVLAEVDDLVIVAAPDLANLRNAKCLLQIFRTSRPNDPPPKIVLNQIGTTRRAGISPADFASGLGAEIETQISFDPQAFATAANEGQLIVQSAPRAAASRAILALAQSLDPHKAAGIPPSALKKSWFQLPGRSGG